ncbi:MAG: cache domain-containing protein [Telluria sp.]
MHIRAYLFLLALGILLPTMLLSGLSLRMQHHAQQSAALGALGQSANSVALLVDRELYSAEAALRVLAASPSLPAREYRAFYTQARHVHAGEEGWSALFDVHGRELVNTAAPFGAPLRSAPDGGRTRQLIAAGKTVVSGVLPGGRDGQLGITISLPVTLPDGSLYLLVRGFSTDHFVALLTGSALPAGWLMAILDGNGRFIARNVNATTLVGTLARPELVRARSNT